MSKKFIIILILILIVLIIGVGIGYFWGISNEQAILNKKLSMIRPIRESNIEYKFIDPLLAYIIPSADQETGLSLLKSKINNLIDNNKKNNNLSDASVFFYDLNRGRWIGVNESEKYNPASIFKVVIMVSYFKESQKSPDILEKYLVYTKEIDDFIKQNPSNTPTELKIGSSYKTEDLINKMIIDSDNGAQCLLLKNIAQASLDYIYNVLDIKTLNEKNDFMISPRIYSLFFRILYSATYLNNIDSEKSLDILSKTTFNNGIVAGVDKSITVSHKFGEYIGQQIELHDCGIVYYSSYPYFLCVMTRGNNLNNLENAIKNISSIVYQEYKNYK